MQVVDGFLRCLGMTKKKKNEHRVLHFFITGFCGVARTFNFAASSL